MKRKEKIKEFKRMDKQNIASDIMKKKEKLRSLGFDLAAGKVKNVREIRETRKDIARLKTLIKQK